MLLQTYQNASDFLAKVQDTLMQDEIINGFMLGTSINLTKHPEQPTDGICKKPVVLCRFCREIWYAYSKVIHST